MKTILTIVLVAMVSTFSLASETSVQAAKKILSEDISENFKAEMKKYNNFFYENGIDNVREDVKVSFYVDDYNRLVLLKVATENPDARDYVKHFFKNNQVVADDVLVGSAFTFDLHLRYRAQ